MQIGVAATGIGSSHLFEDGIIKAIRGITTIEEVLRITQRDMVSETFGQPKKP